MLKNPSDDILSVIAVVALLEESGQKGVDWFNLPSDILQSPLIIPLNSQKIILALKTSQGTYNSTNEFFILSQSADQTIEIKPYNLPQPKTGSLDSELNVLPTGNLSLEKKGVDYYLHYGASISSVGDKEITWKINENSCIIIE